MLNVCYSPEQRSGHIKNIHLHSCKHKTVTLKLTLTLTLTLTDTRGAVLTLMLGYRRPRMYKLKRKLRIEIAKNMEVYVLNTTPTFSQSLMVSVGVSKLGFTDLIIVDPGVKINGAYYRDVLLSQHLLPVVRNVSGEFFIFQQDSAPPAHRARDTVRLLKQATPAFTSLPPSLWPRNSPDLNSVDYKICGVVQQRVYQSPLHNIDELKQRLLHVWHGMDQSVIDNAIDECLRACVRADCGHFEQLLWQ